MIKKILLTLSFVIILASFASAEIIINQQPRNIYNLGGKINLPITLTSSHGIYDYLRLSLICENNIQILPKEEISLPANEVVKITKSIFLINKFVGDSLGKCKIKIWLQDNPENYVFTEKFNILDVINLKLKPQKTDFNPGDTVLVKGEATKQDGEPVNGFLELNFTAGNSSKNKTYGGIITNGFFSINFNLPKLTPAGKYLLNLNAYEKGPLGNITNKGFTNFNIRVNQIPTSLEILFDNQQVEPGTNLKVEAILHDQTGKRMNASAIISIKNEKDKILEQTEKPTGEFLEFPIPYNEPPSEWTVFALSAKLSSKANFKIKEKADVKIEIINRTVIFTNVGNVPYNKQILVKIGNKTKNVNVSLKVDEAKKYILSAPDGDYQVKIGVVGKSKIVKSVALTGNAIGIKESSSLLVLTRYPIVWFFMIFVLGFIALIIFKKGYKKSFFGHIISKRNNKKPIFSGVKKKLIKTKNDAEISLSLSGEKQKASIVNLKIKNFKEIEKNLGGVEETFNKINKIVEESKVFVYENQENLFFIFSPIITRTFNNEKNALALAQKIGKLLKEHNKLFRQRVSFGISLNSGEIISKKEGNTLRFMSFGNLMINAKKIASLSDSEVYLNEEIKNKLINYAKINKHEKNGITVYTVEEMKDRGEHKKFINDFLKRIERKSE